MKVYRPKSNGRGDHAKPVSKVICIEISHIMSYLQSVEINGLIMDKIKIIFLNPFIACDMSYSEAYNTETRSNVSFIL